MDSELEFAIQHNTTGKQLFDQVAKTLGLREIWYFGLQYIDNKGCIAWLKLNRKISSQDIPKEVPYKFLFRAQFFPEDASEELIQEITQHLFYLQVKKSILDGEIYCPAETCVLLASYACQMKYGDYNELTIPQNLLSTNEKLMPDSVLNKHTLTSEDWESKIVHWYKELTGLLKEDATIEYLKLAQDLEMYGVNYFPIKNRKGSELYLGVDALGLNIYEKSDKLSPKLGFPWSEIRHISFSDKRFIIKSMDKKGPDFIFYAERLRINKRILALSMGNHELYMRRRTEDTMEIRQMKAHARDEREMKLEERERYLTERRAREQAQKELESLQEKLAVQSIDNEKSQKAINDYEERINLLENRLEEENRGRLELEEMQNLLNENKVALEKEHSNTSAVYSKLLEENERIRSEIHLKNERFESASSELQSYRRDLQRLLGEKKALLDNVNGLTTNSDGLEESKEEHHHEFSHDQADNSKMRDEENRSLSVSKDACLMDKLKQLSADLQQSRDLEKLENIDHLHDENQKNSRDKFKTLKLIRQGNTKKRIDEFEAM